ncbi:class I SAM-dependent methyltransferase [Crateriforma spongiae]|uniref:class I SAM-dependent methyltransferase n=1 Tax=Crateriforma spongiae TaxID=2724528 RepID=UPI0039AEDE57
MRLLNVGCGRCIHPDWTNIDMVAHAPSVIEHDLRRGLPFSDDSFDGIYSSHVLEHLTPASADAMLAECRRVLRPGGVLRIVVPDLEGITREYLHALEKAAATGDDRSLANHQWMTIELIDQLVRERSGGRMGPLLGNPDVINRDFIRQRLGHETDGNSKLQELAHQRSVWQTLTRYLRRKSQRLGNSVAEVAVRCVHGRSGRDAYRECRFRQCGEVHRWMYDRVSLAKLLTDRGFSEARVCRAEESQIDRFDEFQLDRDGTQIRKPDSLFMEAINADCADESKTTASARRHAA